MYNTEKTFMQVLVKELPAMRVASYRIVSSRPECEAIHYMKDLIIKNNLNFNSFRKFGIDVPVLESQHKMGFRGYEYWVCLPSHIKNLEGTTIKKIAKGNYAVLRIENPFERPFDKISNGWMELHDWIKTSGYKSSFHDPSSYMLEELIMINGVTCIDLFYPVCIFEYPN